MREYMNIRLSYEAKLWIEKIQNKIQEKLDDEISTVEQYEIETLIKDYLKEKNAILSGVSITNILKVSTSSVIEDACYSTWDYSLDKWLEIDEKMQKYSFKSDIEVGSLTPKLYLEKSVVERLKKYQKDFMKDSMVRVVKMSYVIKVVVFAHYLKLID
ncbi:Uncharacterised protein [Enterococcus durans]|uniref:hypothetical protein n=1 Tax=Enterococcus TaxID=1350 RepID=UPI000E0470E8|nr:MULTISPECIES: hypothetical protein [Enterococcus]MDO1599894.1 hypothetical protein [Enterococcus faecium]NHB73514.1 hypothetical protein [Enterococcus faecium]STP37568.1 Uncharacterised protein [Enterococcus durans]STP39528.1 Uncharacterised protein [Enterococcus durans]